MKISVLIAKVLQRLKITLPSKVKVQIPGLIKMIKISGKEKVNDLLMSFREDNNLSDAQFGEVLNRVIDAKVFMTKDNKRDEEKIYELKKLTNHPPIKVFFDRLY